MRPRKLLLVTGLKPETCGQIRLRGRLAGELVLESGQQALCFAVLLLGFLPGIIGLLALLTLLFVVRPVVQRFSRRELAVAEAANEPALESSTLLENEVMTSDDALAVGLPKSSFRNDDNLPPQSSGLETKVEYLQMLAQSETERVAEVLKQWINSNERTNSKQE